MRERVLVYSVANMKVKFAQQKFDIILWRNFPASNDLFAATTSFPRFRRLSSNRRTQAIRVSTSETRGLTSALTRPVASCHLIVGSSKLIGAPTTNSICRKRLPANALNQS